MIPFGSFILFFFLNQATQRIVQNQKLLSRFQNFSEKCQRGHSNVGATARANVTACARRAPPYPPDGSASLGCVLWNCHATCLGPHTLINWSTSLWVIPWMRQKHHACELEVASWLLQSVGKASWWHVNVLKSTEESRDLGFKPLLEGGKRGSFLSCQQPAPPPAKCLPHIFPIKSELMKPI